MWKVSSNEDFFSLTKNQNKEKLKQNGLEITMDVIGDWEDILHKLPYIGSVLKLAKAGLMIRDFQFIKKVCLFLNSSNGYDDDEFNQFYNGLKEKDKIRISDFLINTILNIDENAKAEIIGYIYKHRVKKQIDDDMMIRLCAIVNRCHLSDLKELPFYIRKKTTQSYAADNLFSLGLLANIGIDGGNVYLDSGGIIYQQNQIGELLYKILDNERFFD